MLRQTWNSLSLLVKRHVFVGGTALVYSYDETVIIDYSRFTWYTYG
jgi:hypothetical protein